LSYEDVAQKVLEYIQKWVPERGAALLAGSTVHADMRLVRLAVAVTVYVETPELTIDSC